MFTYDVTGEDVIFSDVTVIGTAPGGVIDDTTVFEIEGGNLILSGGAVVERCGTAVDLLAGTCTVKDTKVSASEYSFNVEDYAATLYFNTTDTTQISGAIYLAEASAGSSVFFRILSALSCQLVVECENPNVGDTIAAGSGYVLTAADAAKVSYINSEYKIILSGGNLVLSS
jgi:hypothetical protein